MPACYNYEATHKGPKMKACSNVETSNKSTLTPQWCVAGSGFYKQWEGGRPQVVGMYKSQGECRHLVQESLASPSTWGK